MMRRFSLLHFLIVCVSLLVFPSCFPQRVEAQVTRAAAGLEGVQSGAVDLGDIDDDGDLDVVVVGETENGDASATLYRNEGDGTFTSLNEGLTGVVEGTADFADADGDADLDLLITGTDAGGAPTATLYENDGSGNFSEFGAGLTGVKESSADWGDVNGNGGPDLVITGKTDSKSASATLYKNDGSGNFTPASAGLLEVAGGTSRFGDYNDDGELDLLIAGDGSGEARLYENDGSGSFTSQSYYGYQGGFGPNATSADWADIDGDGDLDLLILDGDYSLSATIYRNEGFGDFQVVKDGLGVTESGTGSVRFEDVNGDGMPDAIAAGSDVARVYLNGGSGDTFERANWGLTEVYSGAMAIGDLELDGDNDLAVVGNDNLGGASARLYVNRRVQNQSPGERPEYMRPAPDTTIAAGLTYNYTIEAGDPEGDKLAYRIYPSTSGISISPQGSGAARLTFSPSRDDGGTSPFVSAYVSDDGLYSTREVSQSLSLAVSNFFATSSSFRDASSFTEQSARWGDFDQDGDLDLLMVGDNTVLYENENETFNEAGTSIRDASYGEVGWADIDGDGDLDVAVANEEGTTVYKNEGGTFTSVESGLPGERQPSLVWGDFDRDGDPDLVVPSSETEARFFENKGDGEFAPREAGLPGFVSSSAVVSGDIDQDGDLDLILSGAEEGGDSETYLCKNDGTGHFTVLSTSLPGTVNGGMDLGDYDQDGDLDLLLAGKNRTGEENEANTAIYENDGTGTFTKVDAGLVDVGITYGGGSTGSTAEWGDLDADGDLDAIITGWVGYDDQARKTFVYRNEGDGEFNQVGSGLVGVSSGTTDWGDYDGDGDLDLFILGYSSSPETHLYENLRGDSNVPPNPPSNLSISRVNGAAGMVSISWEAEADQPGSSGGETAKAALGHGLYVKESSSGTYLDPPRALTDGTQEGKRMTPTRGTFQSTSTSIRGLDNEKQYTVGVQSVDHSFAGSEYTTITLDGSLLDPRASANQSGSGGETITFAGTGTEIKLSSSTSGSREITVERFSEPPVGTRGIEESKVSQYSIVIEEASELSVGSETKVRFDVSTLDQINDPSAVSIYARQTPGRKAFDKKPVEYNPSTNELVATVSSFGEFVFASDTNPLPVELASFEGSLVEPGEGAGSSPSESAVRLTWKTASESNNAGFEVQRKVAATGKAGTLEQNAWEKIGYVESKVTSGTTTEPHSYQFTDMEVPYSTDSLSYRLRQVDTDGSAMMSDPVMVVRNGPDQLHLLGTAPNPVRSRVTVRYGVSKGEDGTIRMQLYDTLGRQVRSVDATAEVGRHKQILDVSGLPSGVYILRLSGGGQSVTQKITVVQ